MRTSEALWEIFRATGHIGAYLLYKDYGMVEKKREVAFSEKGLSYLDNVNTE